MAILGRPISPGDVEELLCGEDSPGPLALQRRRVFLDMIENLMAQKESVERDRQRETPNDR